MKKNYIIVTGGAGFIGSNLIERMIKTTKYNMISLDDYSSGFKKNHIKSKRVKYIDGETVNFKKIFFKYRNKIKTIFHFGEFSRIHQSFLNYEKCIRSNLKGSFEVITFATKNKIRIIYSATSSMLGNDGKMKIFLHIHGQNQKT